MKQIYLDHAATTPMLSSVTDAMMPYFSSVFHNPGGLYSSANKAKEAIEQARNTVASFLQARPREVYFLDGATLANNLVLHGIIKAYKKKNPESVPKIITSSIEHSSIYKQMNNIEAEIVFLPVDQNGRISLKELREAICKRTILVSISYANGEIGSIEDIKGITKAVRHHRKHNDTVYPYVHTDAVQACYFLPMGVPQLGIDALTISGSKIYGPKKIAALYIKSGVDISPIFFGGDQEFGMNPGTENVPYIVGLETAISYIDTQEFTRLQKLKDILLQKLKSFDVIINTPLDESLPHIVNVSFKNLSSEEIVLRLNARGIECSVKSACASGEDTDSHVILALRDEHTGSIRFSLGKGNTLEDIEDLHTALNDIIASMTETQTKYS